jgi:hypothetical protein
MSSVTFGKRIVGEEEHKKAVAAQKGGAEVFGKRVRGALGADNPDNTAKANSEFGVRTVGHATATDTKGKGGDVSVEDLAKLLDPTTGNTTMFDSLYENELARPDGPRKAALEVFLNTEIGTKGAGRPHVIKEIRFLLGLDKEVALRESELVGARQETLRGQEQRAAENKELRDVPRLRALREKNELLTDLRSSKSEVVRGQLTPLTTEGQVAAVTGEAKNKPENDEPEKEKPKPAARKRASTKRK